MTGSKTYVNFRISVPQEFEEVFSHFYFAKNNSDNKITKTLLPSYQTIMVFNFNGKALFHSRQTTIETDRCLVLGPVKKAFDYSLLPNSQILAGNFRDDAFYRFL
jgi:hypothetical protein